MVTVASYINRLGLQGALFSRIEHDDAIVAVVYKVLLPDQTAYILKICKRVRHYYYESYFLNHFAARIPVPRIVQLIPPEAEMPGAVLMEYLPGELLSRQPITETVAYGLGTVLAKIHAERMVAYGDIGELDTRRYHCPRAYVAEKFEEAFSECAKHLPPELLKSCRQYYDAHLFLLSRVDGPCLTHRDFRPANIIVDHGELRGIIDWSSSRSGFAEEDFVPLEKLPGQQEGGEWNLSSQNKEAFLAGYAAVRPVPAYQEIMPFLQLVRALFTIGYTIKSGTWNSSGARAYRSSLGIVEQVLPSC